MKILRMEPKHWPEVKRIYQEGIDTGNATFEKTPPETWQEWSEEHINQCSLVCLEEGKIIGWAAISPISTRCVYQGVGETSVYVTEGNRGKGAGEMLLDNLIKKSEGEGIWTLQAGIFPENESSINLHKNLGFQVVVLRKKIGKMGDGHHSGIWRDVVLMEKRSPTVGVD